MGITEPVFAFYAVKLKLHERGVLIGCAVVMGTSYVKKITINNWAFVVKTLLQRTVAATDKEW